MKYTIIDIECDNLLENVTTIYCLYYMKVENNIIIEQNFITNYDEIKDFILAQDTIVGHNIVNYDIPVIEKTLSIKVKTRLIDTLVLSWYLYPKNKKHGLEQWGDYFKIKKKQIEDWQFLEISEYIERCRIDVKINYNLFIKQLEYLNNIYDGDITNINNIINYLVFKMDCIKEQLENPCEIDIIKLNDSLEKLEKLMDEKINILSFSMPKVVNYKEVKKPTKFFRKDGSLTISAVNWFNILEERNLPETYDDSVFIKISEELGNPNSSLQLKEWLYSLGWIPDTYEVREDVNGNVSEVPQIYDNDEVCDSIKKLYVVEPMLEHLNMLSLIRHRLGILKSFKKEINNNLIGASIAGLTNTLRFKHKKPMVNLPKGNKFFGKEIRELITTSPNYVLCGSDMSSLEDSTKQHYMYFFDPEYVTQMRVKGFDPHIDIAVFAELMTKEEESTFKELKNKTNAAEDLTKEEKEIYYYLNNIRGNAKVVNFSAVYGAGPPKIAKTLGCTLEFAKKLHKAYWDRNKAVKAVAKSCIVKKIIVDNEEQMWLFNPVSGFWYSLRYEKDIFSTLNQSTGVYCFDLYVFNVRQQGIKIQMQMHDEILFKLLESLKEEIKIKLKNSIDKVNAALKLNIPLNISFDFGANYYQVH